MNEATVWWSAFIEKKNLLIHFWNHVFVAKNWSFLAFDRTEFTRDIGSLMASQLLKDYKNIYMKYMVNHKNYNFLDCAWFKNPYASLIHLPGCYRIVCYQIIQ